VLGRLRERALDIDDLRASEGRREHEQDDSNGDGAAEHRAADVSASNLSLHSNETTSWQVWQIDLPASASGVADSPQH
jgi:hypothetical protein